LEGNDLRNFDKPVHHGLQRPVGIFDGGALRQVEHDLEIGLVVERKQLDRDMLSVEKPERGESRQPDHEQKRPGAWAACKNGRGNRDIETSETAACLLVSSRRSAL